MIARNVSWGLDIGHSALKAVKLARSKGGVEVVEIDVFPYGKTLPKSGADADDTIQEKLQEFVDKHRPRSEAIAVSMPGHAAFYRPISLPAVEKKKISQLVQFEARQMIPFPLEEVVWDYQTLGEVGLGEEMEVGLFAIKKEVVYGFLANVKACGLETDIVQIAPLAVYNLLQHERPGGEPMIALDMGAENTDLIVSDGQKLWLRNLHVAGDSLTRALEKKFRLGRKEAEELRRSLDDPKRRESEQGKKVFGVVKPILADLVSEVQRSIGFYKSQAVDVQFDNITVLGNAFRSDLQLDFLKKSLGYNMSRLSELTSIDVGPKVDEAEFKRDTISFGVALGLALQGLGLATMTVNLMPPEFVIKKRAEVKKPFAIATAAAILLGLALSYVTALTRASAFEDTSKLIPSVLKEIKEVESQYMEATDPFLPESPMVKELDKMVRIGAHRKVWVEPMKRISESVPKGDPRNLWVRTVTVRRATADDLGRGMSGDVSGFRGAPDPRRTPGFGATEPAPGDGQSPARSEPRASELLFVEIRGIARDHVRIKWVEDNFLKPIANSPYTSENKRATRVDSFNTHKDIVTKKLPRPVPDMNVLEFVIHWLIDVEKLHAHIQANAPRDEPGKT